jgi:hypothetical protein
MARSVLAATLPLLLWPIGCGPPAEPPSTRIEVIGTNDPAIDVAAVQEALDGFQEVQLLGEFDFGDNGSVHIRRPVELSGASGDDAGASREDSAESTNGTTPAAMIRGGVESITIENSDTGQVTIRDLALDGATGTAILYLEGQDLLVQGVRIVNVMPGHVLREIPRAVLDREITGRFGINAWDWDATNERPGGRIRGAIRIMDCDLDLSEPASGYSRAIVTGGGEADVTVTDTEIRDINGGNTIGVEIFLGNRTITIERNRIEAGLLTIGVFGSRGPVHLRGNELTLTGETEGSGVGVLVATHADDAGEIANNSFRLADAAAGILTGFELLNPVLSGPVPIPYRNGRIRDNSIAGTLAPAADGVFAGIVLGFESTDNVLEENDLGGLALAGVGPGGPALGDEAANAAHVHLGPGTSGNVVRLTDPDDTVEDEGSGNQVETP